MNAAVAPSVQDVSIIEMNKKLASCIVAGALLRCGLKIDRIRQSLVSRQDLIERT